jgi:hypothetical protein
MIPGPKFYLLLRYVVQRIVVHIGLNTVQH